jgi:hypothetical protein
VRRLPGSRLRSEIAPGRDGRLIRTELRRYGDRSNASASRNSGGKTWNANSKGYGRTALGLRENGAPRRPGPTR